MQPCVDDVADELDALSFESTVTTASGNWAAPASLALSSTKPHMKSGDLCWDAIRRARSADPSLGGLRVIRQLGSGDIGNVYLVELKCAGGCVFAAKVMDKKELEGRDKERRARTERGILELLDHPFLPTLYATLDSPRWCCLLTEFCPGGDLHILRERQPEKRFDAAAVRFYASEVVVALEYLHMLGIVYRDLKPENILVRADGHIMLTDFDLCLSSTSMAQIVSDHQHKQIPPLSSDRGSIDPSSTNSDCMPPSCIAPAVSWFRPKRKRRRNRPGPRGSQLAIVAEPMDARSMSFVGTYEYLAPEIILGEGHGSAVDWWTLGIFIFEFFYGVTPFKGTDQEHTLANIVARALEFPKKPPLAEPAKDLITRLLIKDPKKRMGSTMGATAIKRHPFFDGVNWVLLRGVTPPFLPRRMAYQTSVARDDFPDVSIEYY
ncbi:hypothetical protein RHSIM_Rhsim03G0103200 [Rhododendron simsii]|uniref:non-specific serine/threonine protein kinase n=1 Tax=Rhododendron simsii TaxID=118357 RepID=A0A834H686_RHOSS|nr:hypothetical protein RHSIM_Rhsim03G0103200 [Rhododendron simsii]